MNFLKDFMDNKQSEDEKTNRVQNENWIKNDFLNHSIVF
jgi:hypothetical protein